MALILSNPIEFHLPAADWLALARFFAKRRGDGEVKGSATTASPLSPLRGEGGATGASRITNGLDRAPALSSIGTEAKVTNTASNVTNPSTAQRAPSPLNGERAGVRGENDDAATHSSQSLHAQWLALRAKHPEVFTVSADEIDAWHRHEAWRLGGWPYRGNWSNVVTHLSALLATHPDSGDFLPRRAAAYVAMASNLVASGVSRITSSNGQASPDDQIRLTPDATNLLERALADYNRTLAWVDRFPAIARESRKPFVEKRREVYLKLGRKAEADADERELKALGK